MKVTLAGQVVGIVAGKTEPKDGRASKDYHVVSLLQTRKVEGGTQAETVQVKFWNGAVKGLELGKAVTIENVVVRAFAPNNGGAPLLSVDVFGN